MADAFQELIERARNDPEFFHKLVFDPDAALAEIPGVSQRTEKRLRALRPDDVLGVLTGRPIDDVVEPLRSGQDSCIQLTCGSGDTCTGESCNSPTCDGSCQDTCSGESCGATCSHWSCSSPTCSGESCNTTCGQNSCKETCSGESCNGTCFTDTCSETCSGDSCDTTKTMVVDMEPEEFEKFKQMVEATRFKPRLDFLPRARDPDPAPTEPPFRG